MSTYEAAPGHNEQYGKLLGRVKEVSINFDEILKSKEVRSRLNDLLIIRRELTEFFSKSMGKNCQSCQGRCCKQYIIGNITNEDILICHSANFDFPVPDFDFLAKRKTETKINPCLFLGKQGCLLGKFKPFCCFMYFNLRECDYEENVISKDAECIEKLLGAYRKFSLAGF